MAENLAQTRGVTAQKTRHIGFDVVHNIDVAMQCADFKQARYFFKQMFNIKMGIFQNDSSRFNFGEVE